MNQILELSEFNKLTGRANIKIVLHEVHTNPTDVNKNGIHWKKEYVLNNIDSVKNTPLVAQFLDYDNDVPHGHGEVVVGEDEEVYFSDSVVVGVLEDAQIETVTVNGKTIEALVGTGYIFSQRFPNFIKWLRETVQSETISSSVEIGATPPAKRIGYEGAYSKEFRIPQHFQYTGHAILYGVDPADDNAVLLELNSKLKEENTLAKNNEELVVELNEKLESKGNEINELKNQIKEINASLAQKTEELNSTVEQLKEINAKVEEKEKEAEKAKKEKEDLEAEANELKAYKKEAEDKKLQGELNSKLSTYTDEEKAVAKEMIETFSANPSTEGIKAIVSEINSSIAQQIIAERSKKAQSEVNSTKVEDIYSDVYETNSEDETASIEDLY